MILPEGYEAMSEAEIVAALTKEGVAVESAELYARLAKDPEPGFDIE